MFVVKRLLCVFSAMILFLLVPAVALGSAQENQSEPIVLTCWVYYNGMQEQGFDQLLQEFNDGMGAEKNIFIESHSVGSVVDLANKVMDSANNEVGADAMPDMFASYADTAYTLKQMGVVADLSPYMTADEISAYVDAYMEEGRMGEDHAISIFPVAKSSELLLLNRTVWNAFAEATGADEGKLATWEGIAELGHAYFDWTDAQTPEADGDGRAFFGRDAMANYLLIGSRQLGAELFEVNDGKAKLHFDKAVMEKLWRNFYIPYVSGWYGSYGRFRSDDIKTGQIIALVGSTSGAMYFPTEVTNDDGTTQPIECSVLYLPNFEGMQPMAAQQGAGFVVAKSTPEREAAAVTFLKWFTEPERNIRFSLSSGYLPVTKEANDIAMMRTEMDQAGTNPMIRTILETSASIVNSYELYTNKPYQNGDATRKILETDLLDAAKQGLEKRIHLQSTGMSYQDAVAQCTSNEYLELWLSQTQTALESALAQ
ncbi:MAG: extracellular solute-binding protein [Clostridia bacterium]